MELVQYNRDISNINNYKEIAFNLLDNLSQFEKEAKLAITRVNLAAVNFAKFVYQYYVCTDEKGKAVQLRDHVYDPDSGELDLLFFLSLKKQSYLHPGGLHVTKNLRQQIIHVYDLYKADKVGKLPSVTWETVYKPKTNFETIFTISLLVIILVILTI